MNAELKAKWVEALRSGEYRQCREQLHGFENQYCCLGVLCKVVNHSTDPDRAYRWLDIVTGGYGPFVNMNDHEGKSFTEIADYIEKSL